jgi:hypothetical protein
MFRPTPQKMAGLCYVTPVTGHTDYTGKEEEDITFRSNRHELSQTSDSKFKRPFDLQVCPFVRDNFITS